MRIVIACAAAAAVLCGCSTLQRWTPRLWTPTSIEEVNEAEATRVLLMPDCPVVHNPAAKPKENDGTNRAGIAGSLLVAVAPQISKFIVGQIVDFFSSTDKELTAKYHASGAGQLFTDKGELLSHCLVVVRGVFGGPGPDPAREDERHGSLTGDHLNQLGLAEFPTFYFEAWLREVKGGADSKLIAMTPQLLHFVRTHAEEAGEGVKDISILIAVSHSAHTPIDEEGKGGGDSFICVPLQFKDRKEGAEYRAKDTVLDEKPDEPDKNPLALGNFNPLADQERLLNVSTSKGAHFNLFAYVTESEQAGPFEALIENMANASQSTLDKALVDLIKKMDRDKED
jgi:hypothetical protein